MQHAVTTGLGLMSDGGTGSDRKVQGRFGWDTVVAGSNNEALEGHRRLVVAVPGAVMKNRGR